WFINQTVSGKLTRFFTTDATHARCTTTVCQLRPARRASSQGVGRTVGTDAAKALFAGVAAHAFRPLGSFGSAAIGVALTTAGHTYGWPVAVGGSQAIISAMLQALEAHGGTMVTGAHITSIEQL